MKRIVVYRIIVTALIGVLGLGLSAQKSSVGMVPSTFLHLSRPALVDSSATLDSLTRANLKQDTLPSADFFIKEEVKDKRKPLAFFQYFKPVRDFIFICILK